MSRDAGLISHSVDRLDSMQQSFTRRPEFYFFNKPKKLNPLAIVSFSRFFCWFILSHDVKSPGIDLEAKNSEFRKLFFTRQLRGLCSKTERFQVQGSRFQDHNLLIMLTICIKI